MLTGPLLAYRVSARTARLNAVHDDHQPGARVLTNRARGAVVVGVVPSLGGFRRFELDDDETLRLPGAFEHPYRTAARQETSTVPFDARARQLAVTRRALEIGPLDVDD